MKRAFICRVVTVFIVAWLCIGPPVSGLGQSESERGREERPASAPSRQEAALLEPGKPAERQLQGGEAHAYQMTLTAGQLLHAIVDQRGIDIVATLFGPDGKQLVEVDSPNGTQGPNMYGR